MSASVQEFASRLREAMLLINQMESKLAAAQRAKTEPIAIVGLGCRFPGGATGPEAFWRLLEAGGDAITEVPVERWSLANGPPSAGTSKEASGVRWGSFLKDVDLFDPQFFEISPREAMSLDPQQRLLLEVTWEALEHAGQVPEKLMGSRTAVFVGITTSDYMRLCDVDRDTQDIYTVTGNAHSFPSGRLSYVLGLQGPSFSIDSACSSSLVAIHLACQSLRSGESTLALAGGVNLMLSAALTDLLSKTGALSPDGRCRAFDAQANGFVRGEGCGVVVLKRLSDALADGDRIHALIRGSAVNQDGRSTGLTAPNVLSQQTLLRQALESARVSPAEIGYVETHGTGTSLGDPIEIEALSAVLGAPRPDGSVCALGAVKTNMGHLEAAAGVAGLIKAVLSLQHQKIPPNLHYKTLNPRISLDGTSLVIPQKALAWKTDGKPRFAGVSAFGMSGTNAHVVLEEAPVTAALPAAEDGVMLLPLSAKSPEALVALAEAYRTFLIEPTSEPLRDIVYTASVRRAHHAHRLALVGRSREELCASLEAFGRGELLAGVTRGEAPAETQPKVVFVYPGQGSQWVGMGRQLLAEEPVFRRAMEACDAAIQREAGFSVLDELCADESKSKLAKIEVVQPMLFAIEVALTALWRSWGVEPDAVVGHSMGEVAAAHVAGALSLEDAASIICRRSQLLRKVSGQGVMAWCELTKERAEAALQGYESRLSIAASNGPRSTVISGEPGALDEVLAKLGQEGVFFRRVKVSDVASHSPKMEPLLGEVMAALSGISARASQVPIYSTVTGDVCRGEELGAVYWTRNLRDPVLFSQTIERLLGQGYTLFVEVSPQPVLLPSIEENAQHKGQKAVVVSSLRRGKEERRELLSSLGALYAHGSPVAFSKLCPSGGRCVFLPAYPWKRERYWIEASGPVNDVAEPARAPRREEERSIAERSSPSEGDRQRDPREQWLYALSWHHKDHDVAAETTASPSLGAFLLWMDQGATGAALVALLRERGEACVRVVAGDRYARLDDGLYQVDPSDPEGYRTVLREAFNRERPCRGVVHLWSLDATAAADTSVETLLSDQRLSSSSALYLAQALSRAGLRDLPRLVLVTRGAQAVGAAAAVQVSQAPLWGLGRTLAIEHPELRCTRVDLSPFPGEDEASALLRELASSDREDQIALREGGRYVARLVQASFDANDATAAEPLLEPAGDRPFRLEIVAPFALSRLTWREMQRRPPGPGEVEIEVDAASLTFMDVMKATGISPGPSADSLSLGSECAGRVVRLGEGVADLTLGQEVVAFAPGSLGSHVTAQARFVVPRPASLSVEEASSVCTVFMTAYHALVHLGRLQPGERVLIHSAAGGVGLAAVQLARRFGAEIFATAGTHEKRERLRGMGLEHVMDSRSLSFADEVMAATDGAGVDMVLNVLAGEAITKSLSVLAHGGRFLEIGRRDTSADGSLGRAYLDRALTCATVDLAGVAARKPAIVGHLLREVMAEFEAGRLEPLPYQCFQAAKVQDAFHAMAQGQHVGKLVITMHDPEVRIAKAAGNQRMRLRPDASYLITGGLGAMGLSVAAWMVREGARHLVLVGRTRPSEAASAAIAALEATGAEVLVVQADVSRQDEVGRVLAESASRLPKLAGIVHAAAVLDDQAALLLSRASLDKVMAPKVQGAWNLHTLTLDMRLDFFVLCSSISSLMGSPQQANHAAANAFLDALAHDRRRRGLAGLSINWGPLSFAGLPSAQGDRGERPSYRGVAGLEPAQAFSVLNLLLAAEAVQVGVIDLNLRQWLEFYPSTAGAPLWADLLKDQRRTAPNTRADADLRRELERAQVDERPALLEKHLGEQVGRILHLPASRIERFAGFSSLGMDSLMSLELRNRLEASLGLNFSVTTLFTYPNLAALTNYLLKEMQLLDEPKSDSLMTPHDEVRSAITKSVEQLSNDELLALFDEPSA